MKIFGILVSVLLLVFTALFGVSLKTNSSISDLCVELRGMQRDIAVNSRDIQDSARDIRHMKGIERDVKRLGNDRDKQ